ncbi:MAG TPA: LysM peptidoglycan-binding domain-containing protein [Cyclobacteriaceae bacterium]|nr:LysM peptidoglycan-binding domain-containing protein [Cyclobacteriaceae bacterium]
MIHALIIAGFSVFGFHTPADSLGTETVEGKVYILHRVEEKETLYGISRRYGATIESILDANPAADAGLDIGQILKVPYTGQRPRTYTRQTGAGGIHRVEEKETLFSISRLYGISVDELKLWNRLSSSDLNVGQELVIRQIDTSTPANDPPAAPPLIKKGVHEVKAGESMYAIARQYGVSLEDIKRWNNLEDNALKAGQLLFVSPPARDTEQTPVAETNQNPVTSEPVAVANKPQPEETPTAATTTPVVHTVTVPSGPSADAVVQSGLAELIDGTEGNRKYLALHRTAPIGTILKVRNEMNNREVFVRVIGKLPDTALTNRLIIKISRSAYDRLGAIDPRFRVEVTYYKGNQ